MNIKRTITPVEINGETVFLKSPNAALRLKLDAITESDGSSGEKNIRLMAEAIAHCLVDAEGSPVLPGAEAVLNDMDIGAFNAVAGAILKTFYADAEPKNLPGVQASSSPSTSQESQAYGTSGRFSNGCRPIFSTAGSNTRASARSGMKTACWPPSPPSSATSTAATPSPWASTRTCRWKDLRKKSGRNRWKKP